MLCGSSISRQRLFHYGGCPYAQRIAAKNRLSFRSISEAKELGFSPCSRCSRIRVEYRKFREEITAYCTAHDLRLIPRRDELLVISRDDTAWRICMLGDESRQKALLHESKRGADPDRRAIDYEQRPYHVQPIPSRDILGYLCYITRHDACEAARAEKQRRHRLETALLREREISIRSLRREMTRRTHRRRKYAGR